MSNKNETENAGGTEVLLEEKVHAPRRAMVILMNDDYTTMEFVVKILMRIFHKNAQEAEKIMFAVHKQGRGICGVYAWEIAETKVQYVHTLAREAGFPLRCDIEPV